MDLKPLMELHSKSTKIFCEFKNDRLQHLRLINNIDQSIRHTLNSEYA